MHGTVEQQPNRLLDRMNREVLTAVNVILGMTELLLESDLNPEQAISVDTARSSADRLLWESTRILDLSRAETGTLRLRQVNFDLHEMMRQTIDLLSVFADSKGIALHIRMAGEVPSMLTGDAGRLNQILITLVSAAIERLDRGDISVTIAQESSQPESVTLKFSVVDTGPQIPPNLMNRIFDSCAEGRAENDDASKGPFGIALALSKRLAEGMGGGMWAEDGPELGTAFHFKVQLASPRRLENLKAGAQSTPELREMRPLKLLVAEDSPENLILIQAFLKDQPWSIDSAPNGKIALHKATTSSYDLILMDLDMPEMDGHSATRFIRSSECQNELPAVPIVALTAHDEAEARLKSIEAGCTAHVTKPISKAALIETILHYAL